MNKVKITFALLALLCTAAFAQEKGSFTDARDKKTYKTVKIGKQTWLAENLNYEAKDSKCYDNKPDNCAKYGRLYNWETAMEACPTGWRLPSIVDGEELMAVSFNGTLKATSGWAKLGVYNGNGTDSLGFTALPGGCFNGKFTGVTERGHWWISTDVTDRSDGASSMMMTHDPLSHHKMRHSVNAKSELLNVRCIEGHAGSAADKGTFTDSRDKRTYKTIKIGTLNWMAENLDYNAKDSRCYNDKPDNCKKFGRLYEWGTAMRNCPAGWHLPTEPEWAELEKIVGGGYAGLMLASKSGWQNISGKDGNGRDRVGFTALPGGSSYNQATIINGKPQSFVHYRDSGKVANFWFAKEASLFSNLMGNGVAVGGATGFGKNPTGLPRQETTDRLSVRCVQGEAGAEAKAAIAKLEAMEKENEKKAATQPAAKPAEPPKQQPQQQQPQQPKQQQQQIATENCSITLPRKACVSVPKGSCGMMGGKVVAKCP